MLLSFYSMHKIESYRLATLMESVGSLDVTQSTIQVLFAFVFQTIGGSKGGVRDARSPLGFKILSISCSFWEILAKSHPLGGFTPPPEGNPGSATAN